MMRPIHSFFCIPLSLFVRVLRRLSVRATHVDMGCNRSKIRTSSSEPRAASAVQLPTETSGKKLVSPAPLSQVDHRDPVETPTGHVDVDDPRATETPGPPPPQLVDFSVEACNTDQRPSFSLSPASSQQATQLCLGDGTLVEVHFVGFEEIRQSELSESPHR